MHTFSSHFLAVAHIFPHLAPFARLCKVPARLIYRSLRAGMMHIPVKRESRSMHKRVIAETVSLITRAFLVFGCFFGVTPPP